MRQLNRTVLERDGHACFADEGPICAYFTLDGMQRAKQEIIERDADRLIGRRA